MVTNNSSVSVEFSCFQNVSGDSVHESEWDVDQPDDSFDTVGNGYAIATIMTLYLLIGLPWNIVVVAIIIKKCLFMQPTLMLMLNLALSNFLVYIFVVPPNVVTGVAGEYIFGSSDRVRCHVCQTGVATTLYPLVSTHTLSLIAVDRLIYLRKPLTYKFLVTPIRTLLAIIGIWFLSIVFALPPFFGFGQIRFSHSVANCVVFFAGRTHIAPSYLYILVLMVEGALPFLVLCVMYIWILCITRKFLMENLRKTLAAAGGGQHLESRPDILKEYSRNQLYLAQIFSVIFTSSIITWLPLIPLVIAVAALESEGVPTVVYSIAYLAYMSSTVIHPVLQACLTHEIRVTIKDTFAKLCKR